MINVEIDKKSGFCFGVVNAIEKAEEELKNGGVLYCLGDIVHNEQEVDRLARMGLVTIDHHQFGLLKNVKVLLRAHGEPPSTYETAKRNNITLIDASCPVVLNLQSKIKKTYQADTDNSSQIVIYGKNGHAEVNGLVGQTEERAVVVESEKDLHKINFSKNIRLFSQTTESLDGFESLVQAIGNQKQSGTDFQFYDTICRQVSNRIPNLTVFAQEKDIIIFVSGKKSSNGKVLYEHCKSVNLNTFMVYEPKEVDTLNLDLSKKIGICGATSTPRWQMEEVAERLKSRTV
jgi:4-hydroxy-3-methylbut-2-en-1-yl diphosphate reductase